MHVAHSKQPAQGFEAVKQLLQQTQPHRLILGARDIVKTQAAYDGLDYATTHSVSILPLDLSDLRVVRSFAQQTLEKLGQDKLDVLFLNAALAQPAGAGPRGSKWCEPYVVNHLCKAPEALVRAALWPVITTG